MSSSFIGSQIAIITKSQCRYIGKIIGIDAATSSILLGNVKCFGTENRPGNFITSQIAGTIVPIMQFANSDIEDLKIVGADQPSETTHQQSRITSPPPPPPPAVQSSIHDDPAIVTAVISSSNNNNRQFSTTSSQLMHSFHRMTMSDEQQSTTLSKKEDGRLGSNSNPIWSLTSMKSDKNNTNNFKATPQQSSQGNKSRFFDDFTSNNSDTFQADRYQPQPSTNHSSQTSRDHNRHHNGQDDDSQLPVRQPFFSDDRPCPSQHIRQPIGHTANQSRYFYNHRPSSTFNQQRQTMGRGGGGGNRETFHGGSDEYNDDFDFETSNRKFNKLASEDEFKQQTDSPASSFRQVPIDNHSTSEHVPLYDKKKSFFDKNVTTSNPSAYNRSTNRDTFGQEMTYHQNRPVSSTYRRMNNNYRPQNNNNGYQYHY